jgi:hypothetical protein
MRSEVSEALRQRVAERAYHVCEYCLVHEDDAYHGCEMDHIVSVKHEGDTVPDNLAYACFHCNRHKGTDIGSPSHTGDLVRFFNPRTDRWSEHFHLSEGRIEGLTQIGIVTARALDFNHAERVALRRLLAQTGRHPTIEALARMKE